ncbi:hypothetical protein DQ04_00011400 [Trypanosoma grayi]|uniref:hypothetical protein n=1 Tax=Trypanosoma grayi TaxID=71804 RepID=UPI0004F4ACE1|nr:hypothetical protein DQ04_00011400 [Trypanosoma grayi]KEG15673.1 hypothetical protein DQ04_00011400 [Trypanosoma grayi]
MRRRRGHEARAAIDAGLNSSDVTAADAESQRSASKRYSPLTPIASFAPDDLARLRRAAPDAYQALMQYEQMCRQNAAVVEAKEVELQRCIDVGQEVLGQMDQLQQRCSQLARERDDAVAKAKELQQRSRRHETTPPRGESSEVLAVLQRKQQELDSSLREQLRQSNAQVERLQKELEKQQQSHETLKRDLQGAVEAARCAGVKSEVAEEARRSAEASLAEMQRCVEQREREAAHAQTAQREAENTLRQQQLEWAGVLAMQRDPQQPSVELLSASALLVALHNQLQDVILMVGRSHSKKQQPSSALFSLTTRLRVPSMMSTDISAEQAAVSSSSSSALAATTPQLERWLAQSLDETTRLVPELSRLLQQLEERLRRGEVDRERNESERRAALDETQDLTRENEQLRQALMALKVEVQSLDAQTDRLREVDSLEAQRQVMHRVAALEEEKRAAQGTLQRELEQVRRQGASELALLQEQLTDERRAAEREIESLRAELNRRREDEKAASALTNAGAHLQMEQHQRTLRAIVDELELENKRLRAKAVNDVEELQAEILRLEQTVQGGESHHKRQEQQYEKELQQMAEVQHDLQQRLSSVESVAASRAEQLQRARSELDAAMAEAAHLARDVTDARQSAREAREQLAEENILLQQQMAGAVTKAQAEAKEAREAKEAVTAALTRQLRDAEIEGAKLQDALHRSTQRAKELTDSMVPVERYEEMETELMQKRELAQQLAASLAAVQVEATVLRDRLDEQQQCLRECVNQMPLSPVPQCAQVASVLQAAAKKAAARLVVVLHEQPSAALTASVSSPCDNSAVATPRQPAEETTPTFKVVRSSALSTALAPPLSCTMSPSFSPSVQQEQMEPGQSPSRTLSPPTSPVVEELSFSPALGGWNQCDQVTTFSAALEQFLKDLMSALDQLLVRPYSHSWVALRQLHDSFTGLPQRISDTHGPHGSSNNINGVAFLENEGLEKQHQEKGEEKKDQDEKQQREQHEQEQHHHQPQTYEDDAMLSAVVDGILEAYVDACATLFHQLRRHAISYVQEKEGGYQRSSHRLNAAWESRMLNATRSVVEREQELCTQLLTAQQKLLRAQQSAQDAQTQLDDVTARCQEFSTRVEHLEERLAAKQREWEMERIQWRDTVNTLQSERDTQRRDNEELREELQRRLEELQAELHSAREAESQIRHDTEAVRTEMQQEILRLERELQEARASQSKAGHALQDIREQLAASNVSLQQRQNEEAARARRAERTIEALQQELSNAHAAHQAVLHSLSEEGNRCAAAEEQSKTLSRQLLEQCGQTEELEQRVAGLQEAWRVQQQVLDTEAQKTEALQKVNRALEQRLAEVEGDREPLRQQLQSLLLLQPR